MFNVELNIEWAGIQHSTFTIQHSTFQNRLSLQVDVPQHAVALPAGDGLHCFTVSTNLRPVAFQPRLFRRAALVVDDDLPPFLPDQAIDALLDDRAVLQEAHGELAAEGL